MAPKEEKLRKKAEVALRKAEVLMDKEDFKKASSLFEKSAKFYAGLDEWKIAEQCYYYAGKCIYALEGYQTASGLLHMAAKGALHVHDYTLGRDYYDIALKSILKTDSRNKSETAALFMSMAFICHFVKGEQEDAMTYVKRFKSNFSSDVFANNPLIQITHNLSNAIVNSKLKYVEAVYPLLGKIKVDPIEMRLIKLAAAITYLSLNFKFNLNWDLAEFERDQLIELPTTINTDSLLKIKNHKSVPYSIKTLEIVDLRFDLAENVSYKNKPVLPIPIPIEPEKNVDLGFTLRTNFPGDSHIGPIACTFEIDHKYRFYTKSNLHKFHITSPDAVLGVELIPEKTPVVNQSFPLQILVSNRSDGDAMEISVEFEFPEEIRMMRGTFKKIIYAISQNEEFSWQIIVKAMDVGEIPIKTTVSFKDGDGKEKGPFTAEIPVNINL